MIAFSKCVCYDILQKGLENEMTKKDIRLIAGILIVAILMSFWFFFIKKQMQIVVVYVDHEVFGKYSLDENQTIDINDTNQLLIQDGKAKMIHANCPDQVCVHQKEISKSNESIICLPNKVMVTVEGSKESEFDAVTY